MMMTMLLMIDNDDADDGATHTLLLPTPS